MIVVRNVFRLQFGKAKEAVALWKEGQRLLKEMDFGTGSTRVLTDLVAPFYTLVFESTHDSLGHYESGSKNLMGNEIWKSWYARFVPLVETGHREIFTIVE